MSELIGVPYTCDVTAFVNIETGEVETVIVYDEFTERKVEPEDETLEVFDMLGNKVSRDDALAAMNIAADPNIDWPAWSFGP
jgi:hypothetical protein